MQIDAGFGHHGLATGAWINLKLGYLDLHETYMNAGKHA